MDEAVAIVAARACESRPDLRFPVEEFAAKLGALIADEDDRPAALARIHADDLLLACACVAGSSHALATLERDVMSQVPRYLAHLRGDATFTDEVRQLLRMKLLVGESPKLAEYTARGPLGAWVRVVAMRTAVDLLRARGAFVAGELDDDALDPAGALDVQHLKVRYRAQFQDALAAAITALSKKQRNLLRMHYVDGITLDKLAAAYRVHAATISRWIADARDQVVAGTHERLAELYDLSPSEFESVVGLVRSQIQVSISRLFKPR